MTTTNTLDLKPAASTERANVKTKLSWFNNKCRSLVLSTLNKMDDACLQIEEHGDIIELGNPNASLKGTMVVHDPSLYIDFIRGGSVGASEGYLTQKWSSPDLTAVIRVCARSQNTLDDIENNGSLINKLKGKLLHYQNTNTQAGSKKNILAHYDLGNDLYTRFLDPEMMYSCAIYSPQHSTLEQAQILKLKTICDKLNLKPSDTLIEIGTGWGALAIYAASNYGCKVTSTTISEEQYSYAQARVKSLQLDDRITLLKQDYRLLEGTYDKLVSIEMIEAVGHAFMPSFFEKCNSLLKPNGKMLIQAITIADQRYDSYRQNIDFIQKYIFPGGCLPSVSVMSEHIAKSTDMMIDNIEDIGLHYARTLNDWRVKFDDNWADIESFGYDEAFKRLWHYYFGYCEGAFIERVISTHHIVARKPLCKEHHDEIILNYL